MFYPVCCPCGFRDDDYEIWWGELGLEVGAWPVKCPSCKKKRLTKDYGVRAELIVRTDDALTVGQQAEKNAKRMGKELMTLEGERIQGEKTTAKKKLPTPWWRAPDSKPLDVSRISDVRRFVETGEK